MRIGLDAKRITNNATGLGNYSRYLVNACAEYFPQNEYFLYSPEKGRDMLRNRVLNSSSVSFHYPQTYFGEKFKSWWRSYGIINELKVDKINLFHGLSNEIPLSLDKNNISSVVTIHDLIFLRYPECYSQMDRLLYNFKYRKSAEKADRIVAVSKKTKEDIIKFWGIPDTKIDVIYQGCDNTFKRKVSEQEKKELLKKYQITTPYILYVGSIEQRKNLLLVLQAIKNIKEDVSLIAIGRVTNYTQKVIDYIKENNLENRVKLLHNIPFSELPVFYQASQIFVYPSFYEGFGIPLLEALSSGIPAIGATGSCLEEAGGPHSLYTNPNNPKELRSLIESILNTPSLADEMVKQGLLYAEKFSPYQIAQELMTVYKRTLQ